MKPDDRRQRTEDGKIRNPNIEIRNKFECSKFKIVWPQKGTKSTEKFNLNEKLRDTFFSSIKAVL